MDNRTANKSRLPCESWVNQNVWSTAPAQGAFLNTPSNSQHLSAGMSSAQTSFYEHLQVSNQSCVNDLNSLLSGNNPHQSNPYKASHISDPSSTTLFNNTTVPNTSNIMSFDQHTSSMLPATSKGKTLPPKCHPQQNHGLQPQHLPFLSAHNPYKASFQPPVTNQNLPLGLQGLSTSLPSCGQRLSTSQASFEGANVDSAVFSGCTFGNALSSSEEQPRWMPSSHSRGAGDMSVPDTATHVNKKQKVTVTLQVDSEKRRSAILHQRAQLLKQLAEMDKLLEKIPQDDSSAEESPPYSAVQSPSMADSLPRELTETSDAQQVQSEEESQSLPVEDCSSPESCDEQEQEETSDVPDDQSFSGESQESASDNDFDSDYGPTGDGDFPSDSDRDSSDESSNSSCSNFEGETPPQSGKKQPKPGSSSDKDKNATAVKETCETDQTPSGIVVLPSESRYSKRNYCLFCSQLVTKMARHLERVHSDRAEVAAAFQYPKKSKERKKIWNKLRNEGNFVHNKEVLKMGKGKLAVRKGPKRALKVTDYIHCLYCRGLYAKKCMFRHMKNCPEKNKNENEPRIGRQSVALRCVLEASGHIEMSDGLRKILCGMLYDDVTQTIINDKIILQFGEQMFSHYSSDAKKNGYLKQNLRLLGRLVLEAAKTTPLKNLEEFFCLSSFRHVVSTVNVLAGYDPESKTYKVPSLALKLGYHLQKACGIVQDNAVKCGDDSMAESAQRFLSAYEKKWNKLVSVGALTSLRETKMITEYENIPNVQDVKRLFFHIENAVFFIKKNLSETPSAENYSALAKVILARTILFNRRKGLEVSSIKLAQFASRKKSDIVDDMDITVSDLERTMCSFFSRVDIRATSGRVVPILLKPSFVSALELLVKVREKCGVPSENQYLFGRPHTLSAYSGTGCIQTYVKECGLKNSKSLSLRKIQKHYGIMLQIMTLNEDEAHQILGPNNQVQALRQNSSMRLDDEMTSEGSQNMHKQLSSNQFETVHLKSVKSQSKGSQIKDKRKWGEAEVRAVERHLMRFIQGHKVPQKNDCLECLLAEPGPLKKRTWRGVKDYVRNRIITLRRQGSSPMASSTHSNRPQKETRETRRTTEAQKTTTSRSAKSKEKGAKKKDKHKWGEAEVQAVERHMMRFIRGHKVPQKDDCLKCLSAEPDPLRTRTWKGVKDYVRNRIIALQRIGSSPMTLPTNTNRLQKVKHAPKTPGTREAHVSAPSRSVTSKDKGPNNKDKHKWGEAEVQAVERHMMRFIRGHKVPQKDDCLKCLSAEPDALRTRTWKGVKDYVRNRITSLKRQSGSSWASYTNNYTSEQAEPHHSTVHYQQQW